VAEPTLHIAALLRPEQIREPLMDEIHVLPNELDIQHVLSLLFHLFKGRLNYHFERVKSMILIGAYNVSRVKMTEFVPVKMIRLGRLCKQLLLLSIFCQQYTFLWYMLALVREG
jgi:hypothetical protein